MNKCRICLERETKGMMCEPCGKSYDRYSFSDGSIRAAMEWAAERARRFERRRLQPATTNPVVVAALNLVDDIDDGGRCLNDNISKLSTAVFHHRYEQGRIRKKK